MKGLRFLDSFFHAIAFLTRIPVPRLTDSKLDWQRSAAYYPIVGFLIGGILLGCSVGVQRLFPQPLAAVLTLVIWVCLTGGLHLDGWMDLADGLGSNRSKERILEIMKDSRVGAMGVIATILLLFIKTAATMDIQSLHLQKWLLVAPLYARMVLIMGIRFFPYIRDKGMGSDLAEGLTIGRFVCISIFAILIPFVVFPYQDSIIAEMIGIVTIGFGWLLAKRIQLRLGGLTGDCYGALVECSEVWVLLLVVGSGQWLPFIGR